MVLNMNEFFVEVEPGIYIASSKLQDYLKNEKLCLNLTWKELSERIGRISPEFLGSIARGTSSNRFSEETKVRLASYINNSNAEQNSVIPNLSTIQTEVLIAEIKKRLEPNNSIKLPHKCPNCGQVASSFEDADDKFGFRHMQAGILIQSWCRQCRTNTN